MMGIFARLFRRRSLDDDVREEIETHIAMQAELNRRSGMPPDEALQSARRQFGNVTAIRERLHDFYGFGWVETFIGDMRHAVRSLIRNPAVSLAAALTAAVGVGAVAGMFSVLQTLLLAPPPHVTMPDRVFRVHIGSTAGGPSVRRVSYPFYERLVEDADTVESAAAYLGAELAVGTGSDARMTRAVMVSAGFWRTLGVRPALGRFILAPEAHPATGARVAVLGHGFWQRRFDGRPDVLGEDLRIKGQPYEIVGVAPRGFRGLGLSDVDLWLPLFAEDDGSGRPVTWHTSGSSFRLTVVGRLRPGVTSAQSEAQLTVIERASLEEAYGLDDATPARILEDVREIRVFLGPVTGGLGPDLRPTAAARVTAWLVGVSLALVVIACLNVAGLLLLRAMRRRREIAVRLALGIGRGRLARQLLTESLVMALLGGAAALAVLFLSRAWLHRTILPAMAWEPASLVNPGVLTVAAAATLVTAIAAGVGPLWYVGRDALPAVQGRLLDAPGPRPRLQGVLLAVQAALSVMLLVGAGLFLRSLHNAVTLDIGLDRDVVSIQVDFAGAGRSPDDVARFYEAALERVSALPGVTRASLAQGGPLGRTQYARAFHLPGSDDAVTTPTGAVPFASSVTPGFFETTGRRMREGRGFLESERAQGRAMVVNQTLARLGWPNRSPIGECVHLFDEEACTTVVGVVADARRFFLVEDPHPYFYTLLPPSDTEPRTLLVRTAPGQPRSEQALRRQLSALDPAVPYIRIDTLGELLNPQIRPWRLGASLFTVFGSLAALLSLIGLWSSVSYAVSQRRHELAVRLAVGSTPTGLVRLVLNDAVRTALIACAAGLLVASAATHLIRDLLFNVSPRDPAVFAAVAAGVLAVATLASLWPALRASRVNPAEALRAE